MNFGLTIAGMVLHTLWKIREHLTDFSFKTLWDENKFVFLWGSSFMAVTSIIIAVSPESSDALTTLTGLDFSRTASYIMLGVALISTTKEVIKTNKKRKNKINE